MDDMRLLLLPTGLLYDYRKAVAALPLERVATLEDSELSTDTFSFYTSVSAVYSSKIEGDAVELDPYVKHKRFGMAFRPDYTQKTDDLYNAYEFARANACTATNLMAAHGRLARHLLPRGRWGRVRTTNMYVTTEEGKIEYVAAAPQVVDAALECFFTDLDQLTGRRLALPDVFFFAALLHLVFVKIHPFDDGNGRSARLLEKWFLAQQLGEKAWLIPSERHYYANHATYYHNIRQLGLEYDRLDYGKALPFLLMLPGALTTKEHDT